MNLLNGIDVSDNNNQANINFATLPIDFAVVKATEGLTYTNPAYITQANGVLNAGKLLGLYHFVSSDDPVKQADAFIAKFFAYKGKAIPFLDFEAGGMSIGVSGVKAFLDRVKSVTGITAGVYMSASTTRSLDWSPVASNSFLWVAQYANSNETGWQTTPWTDGQGFGAWGKQPLIHQFTDNLRLSGWNYALDGNLAYMTKQQWQEMATNTLPTTPDAVVPVGQKGRKRMYELFSVIDDKTGKNMGAVWFDDGERIIALTNPDQLTDIQNQAKKSGITIPTTTYHTSAPYYLRRLQRYGQAKPLVAQSDMNKVSL